MILCVCLCNVDATDNKEISRHARFLSDFFLSDHILDYCTPLLSHSNSFLAFSMSILAGYVNSVFKSFQTVSNSPFSASLPHNDVQFTHLILGYLVLTAFNFMVDRDIVSPNNIDRERFYIILRRLKLPSFFYMRLCACLDVMRSVSSGKHRSIRWRTELRRFD